MSLRVAFRIAHPSDWMGGVNYLLNTCRVLRAHVPEIEPVLFVPPGGSAELKQRYSRTSGGDSVIISERSNWRNNLAMLGFGECSDMRRFADHGIGLIFESAGYYGPKPSIPVLSWLPDFQHRRLPHLFPYRQWFLRELRFRRIIATRRHLLLSSQSARADMEHFYTRLRGSTHVVPFAVQLEQSPSWAEGEQARIERGLPERFLLLPNQFWVHKNHRVVVEALGLLGASAPTVAVTGSPHDPRAPTLFQELQSRAAELGVTDKFRVLGQLPYPDLLALNARTDCLINPSLFEGWSTTVEEARALGTPLLLSDIDLHREQAPQGTIFFDPLDPADCARAMREASIARCRSASSDQPNAEPERAFAARMAAACFSAAS
jgi:glycosyltransferase involved in cell wall biosynthesis